jgi:hypothetical protein
MMYAMASLITPPNLPPFAAQRRLLYALLPGIHRWGTGIRDEEKGDSFANKSRKYSDK